MHGFAIIKSTKSIMYKPKTLFCDKSLWYDFFGALTGSADCSECLFDVQANEACYITCPCRPLSREDNSVTSRSRPLLRLNCQCCHHRTKEEVVSCKLSASLPPSHAPSTPCQSVSLLLCVSLFVFARCCKCLIHRYHTECI